jgi:hypothetical protein
MGVRGEIFSTKVLLQNRTYFFNVKENRLGDLYLNIVESKNQAPGGFERQSVILFADDLAEFLKGFDESLRVLEKAVKEKRKSGTGRSRDEGRPEGRNKNEDRPEGRGEERPRTYRTKKTDPRSESAGEGKGRWKKREGAGPAKPGSTSKQGAPRSGSRVVVRKRKD